MFTLKPGRLPPADVKNIIFFVRPKLELMDIITDNVLRYRGPSRGPPRGLFTCAGTKLQHGHSGVSGGARHPGQGELPLGCHAEGGHSFNELNESCLDCCALGSCRCQSCGCPRLHTDTQTPGWITQCSGAALCDSSAPCPRSVLLPVQTVMCAVLLL